MAVDPERKLTLDVDYSNNSRLTEPKADFPARKWASKWMVWLQDYLQALQSNERMDGRDELDSSLVVWQDEHVMLFVPKAQVSQWELQVMTKPDHTGWPGNIIETSREVRKSLDTGLLIGQKALMCNTKAIRC